MFLRNCCKLTQRSHAAKSNKLSNSASEQLHCVGIPFDYLTPFDTDVTKQCCASGAITEDGILNGLLARTYRSEEVFKVVVIVGVVFRCYELLCSPLLIGLLMYWIFAFVICNELLLHRFSVGFNLVARSLLLRYTIEDNGLAFDL